MHLINLLPDADESSGEAVHPACSKQLVFAARGHQLIGFITRRSFTLARDNSERSGIAGTLYRAACHLRA
jgi:hypothetical protein